MQQRDDLCGPIAHPTQQVLQHTRSSYPCITNAQICWERADPQAWLWIWQFLLRGGLACAAHCPAVERGAKVGPNQILFCRPDARVRTLASGLKWSHCDAPAGCGGFPDWPAYLPMTRPTGFRSPNHPQKFQQQMRIPEGNELKEPWHALYFSHSSTVSLDASFCLGFCHFPLPSPQGFICHHFCCPSCPWFCLCKYILPCWDSIFHTIAAVPGAVCVNVGVVVVNFMWC